MDNLTLLQIQGGFSIMPSPLGGLHTTPNSLQLEQGVLTEAKDIVIDIGGYVRSREGVAIYAVNSENSAINRIYSFDNKLVIVYNNGKFYIENSAGAKLFTLLDTYTVHDTNYQVPNLSTQGVSILGILNPLYTQIGNDTGIGAVKIYTDNTFDAAGVFHPVIRRCTMIVTASPNFLTSGFIAGTLAYYFAVSARFTNVYFDKTGRRIESKPTGLVYFSGLNDNLLSVYSPTLITLSGYGKYSKMVAYNQITGNQNLPTPAPSDSLNEYTQYTITTLPVDIQYGTVQNFFGAALYTNSNQEGIGQENESIPLHLVSEQYSGFSLYGNVTIKKSIVVNFVCDSAATTYSHNITIDGNTTTNVLANRYLDTAKINLYSPGGGPPFYQYNFPENVTNVYVRQLSVSPTNVTVEFQRANFSTSEFKFVTNNTANVTNYVSGGIIAGPNVFPNRIYFSKYLEPEHVPPVNFINVGNVSPILAMKQMRTYVLIFKPDGVFILRGATPDEFTVSLLYPDLITNFPRTIQVVEDGVVGLFNNGVVFLNENGWKIISEPIQNEIRPFTISTSQVDFSYFSVVDVVKRQYQLFCLSSGFSGEYYPYIYDFNTNAWTKFQYSCISAVYNQGIVYYVSRNYAQFGEAVGLQKTYIFKSTTADIFDTLNIASYSGGIPVPSAGVQPRFQLTFTKQLVEKNILSKHFRDCTAYFRNNNFDQVYVSFSTNNSGSTEQIPMTYYTGQQNVCNVMIPKEAARGDWLNISLAYNASTPILSSDFFRLEGFVVRSNITENPR